MRVSANLAKIGEPQGNFRVPDEHTWQHLIFQHNSSYVQQKHVAVAYHTQPKRSLARSCERVYNMQHNTLTFLLSCNVRAKVRNFNPALSQENASCTQF
jgi:hypothetical protein